VLQIAGTLVFLSGCAGWAAAGALAPLAIWAVGLATAWSGLHYLWNALVRFRRWRADARP
jgi:hypothetical protein